MNELHLCLNCLQRGAKPEPIGREKGTQRDPYHLTIDLCEECTAHLEQGDIDGFHARYVESRTVTRAMEREQERGPGHSVRVEP